jgi:hypothetical protein
LARAGNAGSESVEEKRTKSGMRTYIKLIFMNKNVPEFFKVESVALVVVGAHRFGVVVDHDSLLSQSPEGADGAHTAPVKLHTGTDAVAA